MVAGVGVLGTGKTVGCPDIVGEQLKVVVVGVGVFGTGYIGTVDPDQGCVGQHCRDSFDLLERLNDEVSLFGADHPRVCAEVDVIGGIGRGAVLKKRRGCCGGSANSVDGPRREFHPAAFEV